MFTNRLAFTMSPIIKSCAVETPRLSAGEEPRPPLRVVPLAGAGFGNGNRQTPRSGLRLGGYLTLARFCGATHPLPGTV
jgi:hypothetical protein